MNKRESYQKGVSALDPFPITAKVVAPIAVAEESIPLNSVVSSFQKGESTIQPQAFLIIVSGGERREKDYFLLLNKANRFFPNIKIAFNADSQRLDPDGMWEFYKEIRGQYELSENEENPDKYYLISDVDHFTNPLLRIKPLCTQEQVNLIVSNPCFEVWLYYSERSDRFLQFVMPDDKLQISRKVKQFLGEQIPGGINPRKALLNIQQNIANAEANYSELDNGLPACFATNMSILARNIQPYVERGIEQYRRWEEEKRLKHVERSKDKRMENVE